MTVLATIIITVIMIVAVFSALDHFYFNKVIEAESQMGKIDAVVAIQTANEIDTGIDNIRFKYKREEDARDLALARKKAEKIAKEKAEKKAKEIAEAEQKEKEKQLALIEQMQREQAIADAKAKAKAEKEKKKKEEPQELTGIRAMSLKELNSAGHIQKLCDKHNMSKLWFDRISTTESSYGVFTRSGTFNAWGWGVWGGKFPKMGDNWYDASDKFMKAFLRLYPKEPTMQDMRRYCPSGAYDKFFLS